MISLILSFIVLIVGYFVYGGVVERGFAPDDRQTPANRLNDGVDYVPMKTWKAFLVQLLNIAGTGPIFGALMGAIFYGAMICESFIALIWAAGGVAFYGATGGLNKALSTLGQSGVVYDISTGMLGPVGGILAIIGVIACPITSGDTAFRSARLIISEIVGLNQKTIRNRLLITIPLLGIGAILTQLDFNVLWRYFSWSNQTLAMISLWVATSYLMKKAKNKYFSLMTALPAIFMVGVSITYILMAKEGFSIDKVIAYPVGVIIAAGFFVFYVVKLKKLQNQNV
ncbi:MAG: carbon starvation protein A [Lachnospiraceae bacterium]|nr:carbon starvation protein A [Lachnospiraceae bacterium]